MEAPFRARTYLPTQRRLHAKVQGSYFGTHCIAELATPQTR